MQLSETQNKLLAILFAAGEPLEGARLGEAIGITAEEVALQTAGISAWLIPLSMSATLTLSKPRTGNGG